MEHFVDPTILPFVLKSAVFWVRKHYSDIVIRSHSIATHYVPLGLSVSHKLPCPVLISPLPVPPLPRLTTTAGLRKPKLQKVQQSVRESSGHEAAEIGLGWNGIGGRKLIGNDSKCLEGGNF